MDGLVGALQQVREALLAGATFGPHAGAASSSQVVPDHQQWPGVTKALNAALWNLVEEEWDEEARGSWEEQVFAENWTSLPIWQEGRTPAERAALVDRAIRLVEDDLCPHGLPEDVECGSCRLEWCSEQGCD